jgi:hypothetical protein
MASVSLIKRFGKEFKFENIETPVTINTEGANEIIFCTEKVCRIYINGSYFNHDKFTLKADIDGGITQKLLINSY